MSKGKLLICFALSMIVIGFTFLTYGEAVENTLMDMINAGTMPEKYLTSEGWGFDYEPVEHFLMLSVVFTVVYYGISFWLKSVRLATLFGVVALGFYLISYVLVMSAFWQLVGVTVMPMMLLCAVVIYSLLGRA